MIILKNIGIKIHSGRGAAMLLAVLIVLGLVLIITATLSLTTIMDQKISRNFLKSNQAYYTARAGIEDSIYRIIEGKNFQATNVLAVGSGSANINITTNGSQKTIRAEGELDQRFRILETVLDVTTDDISFYYGVQVGEGGLIMDNNSVVSGSVYSNGPVQGGNGATITGDAFVAGSASTLDQVSDVYNSDFIFGQSGNQIDTGQSFTPSITEKLAKVSLYLKKIGGPGDKTLRILTDSGGSPSKTLVAAGATGTLIASQVSQASYSWINIAINTPPTLQAGVKYWIVVDTSASSGNYFSWGRDSLDSYAGGAGKYSPNWNAGSPIWYSASGDLNFKAWFGGVTNSLSSINVGGNAHANMISSCSITGDAYYQSISGSSVGGVQYPGSDDPAFEDMPISDANINDWKAAAASGGEIGTYTLTNNAVGSLGPKKINGDLNILNGADLTVTGTIYVTGNINLSNNAKIRLDSGYGETSGIVLGDGIISVSNNIVFYTNGAGTYLLFLSTKTGSAISVSNNSNTVIFYASKGAVNISNNANLKEVTAYQISISNNAQITYESGLASAKFSSGSGGGWQVKSWQEVP